MVQSQNTFTATYDAWNRLVKIVDGSTTVAEYEYDGLNQRIQKVVNAGADTYDFYYNMKWQAVVEFKNGAANRMNLFSAEYIDTLAVTVTATARHFYTHDANYNVTSAITPSAGVAERYSYSPYGKVTIRDANFSTDADGKSDIGNEFLFTGRRFDPETSFYQFRNRYYSCETGRFVNRDPIGYNGSKWNLYGAYFVPGGVDPFGLKGWRCHVYDVKLVTKLLKDIASIGVPLPQSCVDCRACLQQVQGGPAIGYVACAPSCVSCSFTIAQRVTGCAWKAPFKDICFSVVNNIKPVKCKCVGVSTKAAFVEFVNTPIVVGLPQGAQVVKKGGNAHLTFVTAWRCEDGTDFLTDTPDQKTGTSWIGLKATMQVPAKGKRFVKHPCFGVEKEWKGACPLGVR